MLKIKHRRKVPARASAPEESDEGGLNFNQLFSAISRQSIIVIGATLVVTSLVAIRAMKQPPVYVGKFEILTKSDTGESEVISSVPQTLSNIRQNQGNTPEQETNTKIRILTSPNVIYPVLSRLRNSYPDITYKSLVENLTIESLEPDILSVSYTNSHSGQVEEALKLLTNTFLDYSLAEQQKNISQGLKFVDKQLPFLQGNVSKLQNQLQSFRKGNNLIDPEDQSRVLSAQSNALSQRRLDNRAQLEELRLLHLKIENELSSQPIESASASVLTSSPRYQRILDQLHEVDSRIAEFSAIYTQEYPRMLDLKEQRERLIPLLQKEGLRVMRQVEVQIKELENREAALTQGISVTNSQIKQQAGVIRQYVEIQRELEIATENLNRFLAKREALQIDAAQRQVPWQLLTPHEVIPTPVGFKRSVALGAILGLLLGISIALVRDRFQNFIYDPEELQEITKYPLLGVVPLNNSLHPAGLPKRSLLSITFNKTWNDLDKIFQESFRSLYTNIELANPSNGSRALVITSPTPGNGKSTVAIHLAQAAAAMGQRVLLVDADLRHPSLHSYLGLAQNPGITDCITTDSILTQEVPSRVWQSQVRSYPGNNLDFLPCGLTPVDPTRILSSQFMEQLIKESKEAYDLVIFDSSPLLGLADAYLLSVHVDNVVLVGKLGFLKRFQLEQSVKELRKSSLPILGIIANGVTKDFHKIY